MKTRVSEASLFFDNVRESRQRSAVLVIHLAWLDNSSSSVADTVLPDTPLDMLILYQAAAATFANWPLPEQSEATSIPPESRIVNREQAIDRLQSVADPLIARVASQFASNAATLSNEAANPQDIDYFVKLFLYGINNDPLIMDSIISGQIARSSNRLSDPDSWQ